MKILSWNCQGLGRALTVRNLRDLVKNNNPSIIFLMEKKIKSGRIKKISRRCDFSQELYIEPEGLSGGLALWWHSSISLTVLYKSKNIIHTQVESASLKVPGFISFVYGPPKEGERRAVWDQIRRLAANMQDSWLLIGDFNDILTQSEKEGGNPRPLRKIINFQRLLSDCHLMDLEFKGAKYTWCNKRVATTVRERLDRAIGNVEFREDFDHALVFHIEPIGSDHHAVLVDCCFCGFKATRTFRFEANWTKHEDFLDAVKEGWADVRGEVANRIDDLIRRLKACKVRLVNWSKEAFPNFKRCIDQLKQKLECCNRGVLTEQTVAEAEHLTRQLEEAWAKEEVYWWQRSRIAWLSCGDRNTKFFHNSVIQRRQRNKIVRLKDDRGVWLEEREEINQAFNVFY